MTDVSELRILCFVREPFPTYRVDVDVLFGKELLGRGHCIDFVMQAQDAGTPTGAVPWRGRTVWVGPTDRRGGFIHRVHNYLLGLRHDVRSLFRLARRPGYDAVQVKDRFLIAAIALIVARMRGLAFFYWLSFPMPEAQRQAGRERTARYPTLTWLRGVLTGGLLYKFILPFADHVFVQSECMREAVAEHGIDKAKMTPVPMGIDLSGAARLRARPTEISGREIRLVYLGAIAAGRRLEILIDTLVELRRRGARAHLLIVGDAEMPEHRRALERLAEEQGVRELVEFTGFLPREVALERTCTADIGLSPIYPSPILRVSSPTKLVEYLALGLPVVANDLPDQRFVLRGSRGGVCVPWGARHFARAILWLARKSAAERAAIAERGRKWVVANRSYVRIADELESTYRRLLTPSFCPRPQRPY